MSDGVADRLAWVGVTDLTNLTNFFDSFIDKGFDGRLQFLIDCGRLCIVDISL